MYYGSLVICFVIGFAEFRQTVTPHITDLGMRDAYDAGRELAHRLTLRRYE